jgi:hypothetical protein
MNDILVVINQSVCMPSAFISETETVGDILIGAIRLRWFLFVDLRYFPPNNLLVYHHYYYYMQAAYCLLFSYQRFAVSGFSIEIQSPFVYLLVMCIHSFRANCHVKFVRNIHMLSGYDKFIIFSPNW